MEELGNLYWHNARAIDWMTRLVQSIRQQDIQLANKQIPIVTRCLQQVLSPLVEKMRVFTELGLSWEQDYLASVLLQIEEAQAAQDFILMGDLYELQFIPALQDIQAIIFNMEISLAEPAWWEGNMEALKERMPDIYQALLAFDKGIYKGLADQYYIEATSVGFFTMALEKDGRRWYLHSNRNPVEEARIWARRNYRLEKEKYVLFGWGMGYHVQELLGLYSDINLTVIEPDLGILYHSFHYGDYKSILERITVVWDPEYKGISNLISAEEEVLLYRPLIAHVRNRRLQGLMEQLVNHRDVIADAEMIFYQNIRENIRNCRFYVDEIQSQLRGKRVVIVAGGPSFDKNIEQLRERPEDVVVLAVGTVYKELIRRGIPVNYIVISDLLVYNQVEGLEDSSVPILLLATADRRISQHYQGEIYLVCQQGHEVAADYAKNRGYICYSSGGSVATLALDIAIRLGAGSIAFIGLDLAYYGTRMHASGTKRESFQGHEYQKEPGWDGTELNTTKAFLHFRGWMEKRLQEPDATMQVVDATEGGIIKKGFIPMSLKEFLSDENRSKV